MVEPRHVGEHNFDAVWQRFFAANSDAPARIFPGRMRVACEYLRGNGLQFVTLGAALPSSGSDISLRNSYH